MGLSAALATWTTPSILSCSLMAFAPLSPLRWIRPVGRASGSLEEKREKPSFFYILLCIARHTMKRRIDMTHCGITGDRLFLFNFPPFLSFFFLYAWVGKTLLAR